MVSTEILQECITERQISFFIIIMAYCLEIAVIVSIVAHSLLTHASAFMNKKTTC